jgi:tetratricopeptide (TPR) repeat protein
MERLDDKPGAAADLKKLHDLSPNDAAVLEQLSNLLTDLGDYRNMVQLYEDQILRGKDVNTRAELARKVARMWEEQLQDPREAADAWRRVLRMKPGDPEATAGLERAKSNMLRKPDPDAGPEQYAPPKASVPPPPAREAQETPVAPPPATRKDIIGDTAQFVAALTTDTSETPIDTSAASGVRDTVSQGTLPQMPPARDSEPHTLVPLGDVPSPVASSLDISESDILDADASAKLDALATTDERGALDFGENEHTVFKHFTPPPEEGEEPEAVAEEDEDVIVVDDLAEDAEDEDPGKKPRTIPPPVPRNN